MKKISYSFKVQWSDTDAAGIVFFANFYKWMDDATHNFLNKVGLKPSELYEQKKITYPLLEAQCQFKSPLKFEDEVTIISTVTDASNRAFKLTHDFYENNRLIASGYTWRAWTDFSGPAPKAIPIPDDVREAFGLKTANSKVSIN